MSKARQLADLGNQVDDGAVTGTNMVINGAMTISQRGVSATGVTTNGYYVCDRWQNRTGSSGTGQESTHQQSTEAPDGFNYSYKISCTTADPSPVGSENEALGYKLEGYDLSQLGYGTSYAKPLTLSFWVKSTVTGDYGVQFIQAAGGADNSALKSYTINTASTWEYKTITLDGNTAVSLLTGNTLGMSIMFHLACGPDDQTSAYDWTAQSSFRSITGQANVFASTSDTWQITGVCMNVGDSAIAFPHESYGDTLARCQRYYIREDSPVNDYPLGSISGYCFSTTNMAAGYKASPAMRSIPSISVTNVTIRGGQVDGVNTAKPVSSVSSISGNGSTVTFTVITSSATLAKGAMATLCNTGATVSNIEFDAEL
jgi:hypothetical protein